MPVQQVNFADLFTPTGGANGHRIDASGLLVPFAEPGLDYHPLTRLARGLLVEAAATNLALNSNDFTNASWLKVAAGTGSVPTVTAASAVGPDGVAASASRVQFALNGGVTGTDRSDLTPNVTTTIGQPQAGSFWIQSRTGANIAMRLDFNGSNSEGANYPSAITVTPQWQRFEIRMESAISTTNRVTLRLRGGLGTADAADVNLFNGMHVQSRLCGSDIRTTGATVTRTARSVAVDGPRFTQFFRQGEGSALILWEPALLDQGVSRHVYSMGDNTLNNEISVIQRFSNGILQLNVIDNAVQQGIPSTVLGVADQVTVALAMTWKLNEVAVSLDGAAVVVDSVATIPAVLNKLVLGARQNGTAFSNGWFKSVTHIPQATPLAELPSLAARVDAWRASGRRSW